MSEIPIPLMHDVLRECAQADPDPWLPKQSSFSWEEIKPAIERLWQDGHLVRVKTNHPDDVAFTVSDSGFRLYQHHEAWEEYRESVEQELNDPHLQTRRQIIRATANEPAKVFLSRWILWLNLLVFGYGLYLCSEMNVSYKEYCVGVGNRQLIRLYEKLGALNVGHVIQEEWSRLLRACFVQFGLLHLFFNCYAIYVFGKRGEHYWGWWRFLLIYLIAGVGASCASVYWNPQPGVPRAGASGALCGLLGSELIWLLANRKYLPGGWFKRQLFGLLFIVILIGAMGFIIGGMAGGRVKVDNAGHVGGAIVGAGVGILLHWQRFNRFIVVRMTALVVALAVPVLCVVGMNYKLEKNPTFKKQVKEAEKQDWADYHDEARKLDAELQRFYRDDLFRPVLRKGVVDRDQQKTEKALEQVRKKMDQIRTFQKKLRDLGEFRSNKWNQQRDVTVKRFDAWLRMLTDVEKKLREKRKWGFNDEFRWQNLTDIVPNR